MSEPVRSRSSRASHALLYAAAWLPLSAIYAALYRASGSSLGRVLRGSAASVLPYALLGLLVLSLPRRFPWPDEGRPRFFSLQAGFAFAFTAAGTAGWLALFTLDRHLISGPSERSPGLLIIAWQALIGALIFLSIAGAAYARENAARVREEAGRAARAEVLRARAELALLRTQLNPHFLMNTLHTLIGLVRREPEQAERALERLGELLHYGLRLHREAVDLVTLREEWQFVSGYLEIESLRMGDRLRLSLEEDPEAMECLIPPFSLQPLVENAIVHGLAPRREGGRLAVAARLSEERLKLEVCDDGPGLNGSAFAGGANLGLRLLRERLSMLYDGRAALRLEPAVEGGLCATLELPVERLRRTDLA